MSVAQLTVDELSLFSARCVDLGLLGFKEAVQLSALISQGNCAAWAATYNDRIEPEPAEDIERVTLDRLARGDFSGHWGPLAYNMIANNGLAFSAVFGAPIAQDSDILAKIRELEEKVREHSDADERKQLRADEDAVAFDEVGNLTRYPISEILSACKATGCERIIVAKFGVNESDSQSDYFGGRTARRVVIGFGKGKRESFKQLRKAAADFPPTAHLGPGFDRYQVYLAWDHDRKDDPARAFIGFGEGWDPNEPSKDQSVVFHYYSGEYSAEHGRFGFEFNSKSDAEAFVAANEPKRGTYWKVSCDSYEHRENWSMGGGNYLGGSRYGGWKVSSGGYFGGELVEWWNPVAPPKEFPAPAPTCKICEMVEASKVEPPANVFEFEEMWV